MAKLSNIKKAKRTASPSRPFGSPSENEAFEILIPEGAASGRIPAGDQYIGKLTTLISNVSRGGQGNPQLVFGFELVTPRDFRGMDFQLYCPKVDKAMWKLGDTLTALGIKYEPGKPFKLQKAEVLGTLVRMIIKDEQNSQTGRDQSKLVAVLPHPDGAGKKAKSAGFVPPEEEDDDEEEDTSIVGDEEDDDEPTDEDEEEEEDDEDEEEEDEAEDEEEGSDDWSQSMTKAASALPRRGRPKLAKDDTYEEEEVTPRKRRGPAVVETPVKKRGRPARR